MYIGSKYSNVKHLLYCYFKVEHNDGNPICLEKGEAFNIEILPPGVLPIILQQFSRIKAPLSQASDSILKSLGTLGS